MIIQESRAELAPRLADMIGNYEFSGVHCCIFAVDGTLLLPTDNTSIIHAVEAAKLPLLTDAHAHQLLVSWRLLSLPLNVKHPANVPPQSAPVKWWKPEQSSRLYRCHGRCEMHEADTQHDFHRVPQYCI